MIEKYTKAKHQSEIYILKNSKLYDEINEKDTTIKELTIKMNSLQMENTKIKEKQKNTNNIISDLLKQYDN